MQSCQIITAENKHLEDKHCSAISTKMKQAPYSSILPFIYLYLIDACAIETAGFYPAYEVRERGYGKALLRAYTYAFQEPLNRKLTPKFIQSVHRHAVEHLPHISSDYKNEVNFFGGISQGVALASGKPLTVTQKGFWEFVSTWLIKQKHPIHTIHFRSNTPGKNPDIWLVPFNSKREVGLHFQLIRPGKPLIELKYTDDNIPSITEQLNNVLNSDEYSCHFNTVPILMLPYLGHTSALRMIMEKMENEICTQYNCEIATATHSDEKVKIIIKHAQLIIQLHARSDGNGRTAHCILNRLLHEEGEPLCLVADPNRLDCFAIEELLPLVRQGQQRYLELLQGKAFSYSDKYMKKNIELPAYELPCLKEAKDFFHYVLENNFSLFKSPSQDKLSWMSFFSVSDLHALCLVSKEMQKNYEPELKQYKP